MSAFAISLIKGMLSILFMRLYNGPPADQAPVSIFSCAVMQLLVLPITGRSSYFILFHLLGAYLNRFCDILCKNALLQTCVQNRNNGPATNIRPFDREA